MAAVTGQWVRTMSDATGGTITLTATFDPDTLVFTTDPALVAESSFEDVKVLTITGPDGVDHLYTLLSGTTAVSVAEMNSFGIVAQPDLHSHVDM